MNKIEIINELKKLKINFELIKKNNIDSISEEKVRSGYINKMLESFGWMKQLTTYLLMLILKTIRQQIIF